MTPSYSVRVRKDVRPALKIMADLLNEHPEAFKLVLDSAKRIHHTILTQHLAEGAN